MSAQITEKENFMMFIHGEQPLWVPRYSMAPDKYSPFPPAVLSAGPGFLNARRTPEGGFDIWGVEYVTSTETSNAALPKPGNIVFSDITKWRDYIKAPDLSGIDWETMAKNDLKKINRDTTAVKGMINVGYFQQLMAFMGFSDGLMAMFEEPDEVKAMLQYLADFYSAVVEKFVEYYKPDVFELTDDTATALNPFMSLEMYRELIKPYHLQQVKPARDRGIPIMLHNCGRCEDQIEDWFDCGVVAWNPAQVMNDLDGIKKKYGNRLGLCGCFDSTGPVNWPTATEELVRQTVRDCIDRYAPGGGFCFWGSTYGPIGDKFTEDRKRWITEEYDAYGRSFY